MAPSSATPGTTRPSWSARAIRRALALSILWVAINGSASADLLIGVIAALLGSWASLALLPPGPTRFRPLAIAGLILRFPDQALRAGFDVAWRAFAPGLPIRPGVIVHQTRLAPGTMRAAFSTYAALLPGTVPVGPAADEQGLLVHALDAGPATAAALAQEEALFARGVGLDG